jgi:Spy/CpxP family protein refolding chaperone
MKRLACILVLALALAPALAAQVPGDSGSAPPGDEAEAQQLRKQVRQRWTEHVRSTLGLSDDQAGKLDGTERRFDEQRQPIRARQRQINQALNAELRAPSPNEDRVKQLMSERQQNQLKLQQVNRDEDRDMQGYLTPVQRARYQEERRRFQERVAELVRHRREERQRLPAPRVRAGRRPRP